MSDGKRIGKISDKMEHVGYNVVRDENGEKDLSGQVQRIKVGHPRHGGTSRKEEHFVSSDRAQVVPAIDEQLAAPCAGCEREIEKHEAAPSQDGSPKMRTFKK